MSLTLEQLGARWPEAMVAWDAGPAQDGWVPVFHTVQERCITEQSGGTVDFCVVDVLWADDADCAARVRSGLLCRCVRWEPDTDIEIGGRWVRRGLKCLRCECEHRVESEPCSVALMRAMRTEEAVRFRFSEEMRRREGLEHARSISAAIRIDEAQGDPRFTWEWLE